MIINEPTPCFFNWLESVKWLLPKEMSLEEARVIWERKIKEEESIGNERK